MGIFNFKKSTEELFREKVRESYETAVKEVLSHSSGDGIFEGVMIETAIAHVRKALLVSPDLYAIERMVKGWSPEQIIDEERNRILNKYLINP